MIPVISGRGRSHGRHMVWQWKRMLWSVVKWDLVHTDNCILSSLHSRGCFKSIYIYLYLSNWPIGTTIGRLRWYLVCSD